MLSMNGRELRRLKRMVNKINRLAPQMEALSDQELQNQTVKFRKQLANGATLDDIVVEAFATVREADRRVLGMFPFDVQVMGALVLFHGQVAEMKTGEGKTLTATMPLYVYGLTQKGAMLITPNDYLATRDGEEMGQVYHWLGETVAIGCGYDDDLKPEEKKAIYQADIIYTTNSALGFDYLLDNLAPEQKKKYMRPFYYAIIDEADAVLLDVATTPLVISGSPQVSSNLIGVSDEFIYTLIKDQDYRMDEEEENVWLTAKGIDHLEDFFSLHDAYGGQHTELIRSVNLALKAHQLLEKDKDYVVTPDGEVALLDRANGRILEGMKLQAGQHQAIEMKEQLELTPDTRAIASITYQNLFRQFQLLSGMTGTGKVAEEEFIETYSMKVVQIPTNKPMIRKDLPDQLFVSLPDKLMASLELVKKLHQQGRPILLITANVDISELYSELLLREQISHSVLNAKNVAKEAAIIKEAGQRGRVTVATTMAGRGTDIKLGPGVAELGGLAVIGTEKMPSKRIDQQLQGRAGRQGDPGTSQFFVSLEDDVAIKFGAKWLRDYVKKVQKRPSLVPEDGHLIGHRFLTALTEAQNLSDEQGKIQRRQSLEMDTSVQLQRKLVYEARNALLKGEEVSLDFSQIMEDEFRRFVNEEEPTVVTVHRYILGNLTYQFAGDLTKVNLHSKEAVIAYLKRVAQKEVAKKEEQFLDQAEQQRFYRLVVLKAIDDCWVNEVDNLEQLRQVVTNRIVAQRNPLAEYHQEAYRSFLAMKKDLKHRITKNINLSTIIENKKGDRQIYFI